MLATFVIAALAGLAVQDGGDRVRTPPGHGSGRPHEEPDRADSITQLATPLELRTHGTEDVVVGTGGITTTLIGNFGGGMTTVGGGPSGYSLWEVKAGGDFMGTGWAERFYFVEPIPRPTSPAPLLVFNHRFGKTNLDLPISTTYIQEATARGWYVVAPIAASNKHFVSRPAVLNQALVLDWVTNTPGNLIDLSRVYGVGFSMGGGMVTSYGARHLDPLRPMFAAIVNHSGDVSLNHTYAEDPPAQFIFDFWFGDGNPGTADPEKMAMASVIDYDPDTSSFKVDDDFARNLEHVPLMMVRPTDDLIDYLEVQTDAYDFHIQNVLGITPGPSYVYDIYPYNGHDWEMLPEDVALDFLEQWTLQIPTSGRTMVDRNDRWFWFTTTQDTQDMLSEFVWSVDAPNNAVSLTVTDNLEALTVDTLLAGLDPLSPLTVDVGGNLDGTGDDIYLRDYGTNVPSQVLRDGLPTGFWTIVQGTVRLHEIDSGPHTWQVLP